MTKCIRVIVVDDHLIVRKGLRLMLEASEDLELVGEAADGAAATHVVGELQPDVVLMDVRMPGMDGLEAIAHIHATWPQIAVVILTTYNEDDVMLQGLRAGACGYLLKDIHSETLFNAIRAAARGEMLVQTDLMTRILSYTIRTSSTPTPSSYPPVKNVRSDLDLTEREREVLVAVAHGERSKEIAKRLGITENTVKTHLTSIYTKLGVDSRASAVVAAIERGMLPQPGRLEKRDGQ